MLGSRIGYTKGKVAIDGQAVDIKNFDGVGYVPVRVLVGILGARLFWDKSNWDRIDNFPKL